MVSSSTFTCQSQSSHPKSQMASDRGVGEKSREHFLGIVDFSASGLLPELLDKMRLIGRQPRGRSCSRLRHPQRPRPHVFCISVPSTSDCGRCCKHGQSIASM